MTDRKSPEAGEFGPFSLKEQIAVIDRVLMHQEHCSCCQFDKKQRRALKTARGTLFMLEQIDPDLDVHELRGQMVYVPMRTR